MTPANARAMLDRALASSGQAVTLRRYTGGGSTPLATWSDLAVRAKAIPANSEELVAGINMTGRRLILSPTEVNAASWPAPKTGKDAVMIDGVKRTIEVWSPIKMGDEVVRIEVQIG